MAKKTHSNRTRSPRRTAKPAGKINGHSKPSLAKGPRGAAAGSAPVAEAAASASPPGPGEDQFADKRISRGGVISTDDPIRMYLMQMGSISMLSRQQEIDAARQIEYTQFNFRHSILASDYVLRGAVDLLRQVRDGQLRIDRTIEVSVTNTAEKKRILRRLTPNLKTIEHLLAQNRRDFRVALSRRVAKAKRVVAWRRIVVRRNKIVRLIEELNLRLTKILPLYQRLCEISQRMDTILQQLGDLKAGTNGFVASSDELRAELRYLMRITLESPSSLRRRVRRSEQWQRDYDAAKRVLSAGNLRLVV
ncbi:MAG: hypothetical protein GTO03_06660, partial [Planctomycetales bacterium]|nr:hypothetical protein [Planctomycetales bacterium]